MMFYEEKMIGGILHYRTMPNAIWTPYTIEGLSQRYMNLKHRANKDYQRVGELEGLVETAFKEGVRIDERVWDSTMVHDEWLLSDAYESLTPPATEAEVNNVR